MCQTLLGVLVLRVNRPFLLSTAYIQQEETNNNGRTTCIATCISNKEIVAQADLGPHVEKCCFRNGSFTPAGISITV